MASSVQEPNLSQSPMRASMRRAGDLALRAVTGAGALLVLMLVAITAFYLIRGGLPALSSQGTGFFTSSEWNVGAGKFGALSFIWGTVVSALIAIVIGGGIGVSIAAYLVELAPKKLLKPVGFLIDLLAAIPSIIYGIWGMYVLVPWLRTTVYPELSKGFSWTGLFSAQHPTGTGLLTAGLVLSVMIIPTVAAVSREVLTVVPKIQRDNAMALGATRTEALKSVMIPYGAGGILGALILGLGRALGETMAVAMVIGNRADINRDLLMPGSTLASTIANEFGESGEMQRSALIALGLLLFLVTLTLNFVARALVNRVRLRSGH